MASKTSVSSSNSRRTYGKEGADNSEGLLHKLNQLKRQIQGEREVSIKEKIDNNRKKILTYVPGLLSAASSSRLSVSVEDNGTENMLSRIGSPPCMFNGFKHGIGDKDYTPSKDVILTSIKLPRTEKLPPYTTWIFLDRNQRMAEDQSVVGRRQIYYDQEGGETLICSDSDEDKAEPEEEKHDFCDGEDRILCIIGQEYGLGDEVLQHISQILHVNSEDIMERYDELKLKNEHDVKDCADSGSNSGISLEKSLSDALDSFDNLFCRRCLVFDCRLHGCSQALVDPTEKQPYWSESESDRKPCSKHCYLGLQASKDIPDVRNWTASKKNNTTSEEDQTMLSSDMEEPQDAGGSINLHTNKKVPSDSEFFMNSEIDVKSLISESSGTGEPDHEALRKRDTSAIDESKSVLDDSSEFSNKKQKTAVVFGTNTLSNNSRASMDQNLIVQKVDIEGGASEVRLESRNTPKDPESVCAGGSPNNQAEKSSKDVRGDAEGPKLKQSSIEWKPIEKEFYLKGVEIFGRNSCLIARNLLSGLKTCIEVSSYMCETGPSVFHRSGNPNSLYAYNKNEAYGVEQETPTRTRLFRRRGKTRKLKYSTKSAGHPSHWKRIIDGKNQSCKQYTPCGCLSMCGKECPCLTNETCCEKYCGCSKSCKNRFRGCHCAKSQCRSRQCPCFAAGRECDPDVCRNCWVSCGDGTLGEPSRRGEGQCGNMRLLLRQQQRILLGKSDVAGWGAFLKNSVNKNEYLGEYTGELISHKEADKRGKIYDRANSSFLFDLNDQYVLDAHRKGDKLKFANHSSKPNCYAKVMFVAGDHRVGIFANERIEASEEIFYDYHYGPDQAPAWTKKPDGSKKDDSSNSQRRARKHQSH